jgi:colicin import membrane protein
VAISGLAISAWMTMTAPVLAADGREKPAAEKAPEKTAERKAEAAKEKSDGKTAEKAAAEKPAEAADKDGKPVDRLADKLAKDAASAAKAKKAASKAGVDLSNNVDEPEAQPPPLKMTALRDEVKRHAEEREHGGRGDRESLTKMANELNSAREALREDTARMEALLSGADAAAADAANGKRTAAPLDVVAKAMRGMKPEQAAPILSHMDRKLAADVLRRMPPADAGKVMAFLKPELAAELAAEIAMRGEHPEHKK